MPDENALRELNQSYAVIEISQPTAEDLSLFERINLMEQEAIRDICRLTAIPPELLVW